MSYPKRAVMYTGVPSASAILFTAVARGECGKCSTVDDDDGPSLQTPLGKFLSIDYWHILYTFHIYIYNTS